MPLLSVSELCQLQNQTAPVVVCDVRFSLQSPDAGRQLYRDGHIPGSVFVDLDQHLAAPPAGAEGGRHPLPEVTTFAETLGTLGITPDHTVVAYDDHGAAFASRLWWMLRSIGHPKSYVLDGGWSAWVADDHGVEIGESPIDAVAPYPASERWNKVVTIDDVASASTTGTPVLIDSRAATRYNGESEPLDRVPGHIPAAVNRFHGATLTEGGTHRSTDELTRFYGDVGVAPIVYCGSGVTACHNLLAMELAGIDDAVLFPGSYSHWSADPDRPIATA